MRSKTVSWAAIAFGVLVGIVFGYYFLILDWAGRPSCHTNIEIGFLGMMHPSGGNILDDPRPFPNVNGLSHDSLAEMRATLDGYMAWTNDYNYVPGLRETDPPDLVLMYFNRPTRWNWHGPPPTIFKQKAWIIVPVDFGAGSKDRMDSGHALQAGECSERVSHAEFIKRLRGTLSFIRTNERPNWRTIVAEHEKFLRSVEH